MGGVLDRGGRVAAELTLQLQGAAMRPGTERSEVSKRTIVDFERGARSPHASTLFAIRAAFETAGIEFIDGNGSSPSVRFKEPQ